MVVVTSCLRCEPSQWHVSLEFSSKLAARPEFNYLMGFVLAIKCMYLFSCLILLSSCNFRLVQWMLATIQITV